MKRFLRRLLDLIAAAGMALVLLPMVGVMTALLLLAWVLRPLHIRRCWRSRK